MAIARRDRPIGHTTFPASEVGRPSEVGRRCYPWVTRSIGRQYLAINAGFSARAVTYRRLPRFLPRFFVLGGRGGVPTGATSTAGGSGLPTSSSITRTSPRLIAPAAA